MMALNESKRHYFKIILLKTSAKHLIEELKHENVESFTINGFKDAVQLEEKKNVFLTSAFRRTFRGARCWFTKNCRISRGKTQCE
jgi:16S rRNA (cytosine967-C5)-methyltransferase